MKKITLYILNGCQHFSSNFNTSKYVQFFLHAVCWLIIKPVNCFKSKLNNWIFFWETFIAHMTCLVFTKTNTLDCGFSFLIIQLVSPLVIIGSVLIKPGDWLVVQYGLESGIRSVGASRNCSHSSLTAYRRKTSVCGCSDYCIPTCPFNCRYYFYCLISCFFFFL